MALLLPFLNACTFEEQHLLNNIPDQVRVQSVTCLVDSTDKLDFNAIVDNSAFAKFDGPEIGYGHLRKNLWVRVVLKNETNKPQNVILSTDQIILEDVTFYKKLNSVWQKEQAGWGISIQNRDLPTYLHAFRVDLEPGVTKTFYYKVRNQYQVVRLPLTLYSKEQFYKHYYSYLFLDGLVTMALLTSILYCIYNFFYSSKKDRKTLFLYFLYATNFLIFYSIRVSFPAYYSENQPQVLDYFVNVFIFISTYTFVKFGTSFIDPDKKNKSKSVSALIDGLFGLTIFISLVPSWSSLEFLLYIKLAFFLVTIFYFIWSLIINFKTSILARIYFFMAMPLICTGMLEGLTNVFGVIKVPSQFFEAFRISICLEMLFILFALIFRERYLSKQYQTKLLQTELEMLEARIEIQETEQKRIARDLHDDLGGTLASMKLLIFSKITNLLNPKDEALIRQLAQKSSDDLRRISHALMPPDFERVGLAASIGELVRYNHSDKISFEFYEKTQGKSINSAVSLNIYRVLSELIQNILKHSKATKVLVQLIQNEHEFTLMVEDNGQGFELTEDTGGLGIKNMQARAQNMGGSLNFDSNANGTTVILEVPYE